MIEALVFGQQFAIEHHYFWNRKIINWRCSSSFHSYNVHPVSIATNDQWVNQDVWVGEVVSAKEYPPVSSCSWEIPSGFLGVETWHCLIYTPYAPWCWYIYLHDWVMFRANVGKYSSTMVRIWVPWGIFPTNHVETCGKIRVSFRILLLVIFLAHWNIHLVHWPKGKISKPHTKGRASKNRLSDVHFNQSNDLIWFMIYRWQRLLIYYSNIINHYGS